MAYTVPPFWLVATAPMQRFIGRVNELRAAAGTPAMHSWFRTLYVNRINGGAPDSQHLLGFAVDLARKNVPAQLAAARRLGLIAVDEPAKNHVHVQAYPAGTLTALIQRAIRNGWIR